MENKTKTFRHGTPELEPFLKKYGCRLREKPPFVVVGGYNSASLGKVVGVIAATKNEFFAHLIAHEVKKSGYCKVEKTEYHPSEMTFSLQIYAEKCREYLKRNVEDEPPPKPES